MAPAVQGHQRERGSGGPGSGRVCGVSIFEKVPLQRVWGTASGEVGGGEGDLSGLKPPCRC